MTCHPSIISSSGWSQAIVRQSSQAFTAHDVRGQPSHNACCSLPWICPAVNSSHCQKGVIASNVILFLGFSGAGPVTSPANLSPVTRVRTVLQDAKHTWQEERLLQRKQHILPNTLTSGSCCRCSQEENIPKVYNDIYWSRCTGQSAESPALNDWETLACRTWWRRNTHTQSSVMDFSYWNIL